jgi:GT2 family glycosyltransferase
MLPKVDICVLVHNQLNITKGFIDNLFQFTKSDFNLIFLDNGSTDGTNDFLKKSDKWKLITSKTNLGVINGRNELFNHVTSDFFINLDNDQYVCKGWLNKLFNTYEQGYDIVGCEAWLLSSPVHKKNIVFNGKSVEGSYFPIKKCNHVSEEFSYIGCGGMLIRTDIPKKIGLFDSIFNPAYFEDPDFSYNCIKNGYKLGWCYDCPINHLAHQTFNNQNLFNKNSQFYISWNKFKNKWKDFYPLSKNMRQ